MVQNSKVPLDRYRDTRDRIPLLITAPRGIVCTAGWVQHVLPLFVQVLWKVQRWSEALQTLFNEQVSYCVFHTHVCMCKTCESSIRRSLKKHRRGEPFRFRWGEGNESVAFHFVRQLMLKLASMLCVGIGRIVCSTSLQLCLLKYTAQPTCVLHKECEER